MLRQAIYWSRWILFLPFDLKRIQTEPRIYLLCVDHKWPNCQHSEYPCMLCTQAIYQRYECFLQSLNVFWTDPIENRYCWLRSVEVRAFRAIQHFTVSLVAICNPPNDFIFLDNQVSPACSINRDRPFSDGRYCPGDIIWLGSSSGEPFAWNGIVVIALFIPCSMCSGLLLNQV